MSEIVLPWAGVVDEENVAALAEAIHQQFAGKRFSTMDHSHYTSAPGPWNQDEARITTHRMLDKIAARHGNDPYIYIIVTNNWSIMAGDFVCLSSRALLVEHVRGEDHDVWCWMLEGK
jgi:hypothetical protein